MASAGASEKLLGVRFDDSKRFLSVATSEGGRIYSLRPFQTRYRCAVGSSGLARLRFNPHMLALVGSGQDPRFSPRRIKLMDITRSNRLSYEIDFDSTVLNVLFNGNRMVVVCSSKILVFDIHSDLRNVIQVIDTVSNHHGLAALSQGPRAGYLAYPCGESDGRFVIHDLNIAKSVVAVKGHDNPLRLMEFNSNGSMLATVSTAGTYVRVFSVPLGQKLWSFRRGTRSATVCHLSFSQDSRLLSLCSSSAPTVHIFHLDEATRRKAGDPLEDRHGAVQGGAADRRGSQDAGEEDAGAEAEPSSSYEYFMQSARALISDTAQSLSKKALQYAPHSVQDYAGSQSSRFKITIQGSGFPAAATFLPETPEDPRETRRRASYGSRRDSVPEPPLAGRSVMVATLGPTPAVYRYVIPEEGDQCRLVEDHTLRNLPDLVEGVRLNPSYHPEAAAVDRFADEVEKPQGQHQQPTDDEIDLAVLMGDHFSAPPASLAAELPTQDGPEEQKQEKSPADTEDQSVLGSPFQGTSSIVIDTFDANKLAQRQLEYDRRLAAELESESGDGPSASSRSPSILEESPVSAGSQAEDEEEIKESESNSLRSSPEMVPRAFTPVKPSDPEHSDAEAHDEDSELHSSGVRSRAPSSSAGSDPPPAYSPSSMLLVVPSGADDSADDSGSGEVLASPVSQPPPPSQQEDDVAESRDEPREANSNPPDYDSEEDGDQAVVSPPPPQSRLGPVPVAIRPSYAAVAAASVALEEGRPDSASSSWQSNSSDDPSDLDEGDEQDGEADDDAGDEAEDSEEEPEPRRRQRHASMTSSSSESALSAADSDNESSS